MIQKFTENDSLFCCRHQYIANSYTTFLEKLGKEDIFLAFFIDGSVPDNNRSKWLNRLNNNYKETCDLFFDLDDTPCEELLDIYVPGITDCNEMFIKLSQMNGNCLLFSIENDRKREIAKYAKEHNAVAIIAEDMDFLIYEGNWKLWSGKNLDTKSMTTSEYNRSGFRRYLNLDEWHMPLFATMNGNGLISTSSLKSFHKKFAASGDLKKRIADFVRMLKHPLSTNDIEYIAKDVMKLNFHPFESVLESLDSYEIDSIEIDKEPCDPLLKLLKQEDLINEYGLVLGLPRAIEVSYFVFENNEFMSYTAMVLPIEQRIAGLILEHKNNPSIKIDFYVKKSHTDPYEMIGVSPVYPTCKCTHLFYNLKFQYVYIYNKIFNLHWYSSHSSPHFLDNHYTQIRLAPEFTSREMFRNERPIV